MVSVLGGGGGGLHCMFLFISFSSSLSSSISRPLHSKNSSKNRDVVGDFQDSEL